MVVDLETLQWAFLLDILVIGAELFDGRQDKAKGKLAARQREVGCSRPAAVEEGRGTARRRARGHSSVTHPFCADETVLM